MSKDLEKIIERRVGEPLTDMEIAELERDGWKIFSKGPRLNFLPGKSVTQSWYSIKYIFHKTPLNKSEND